MWNKTEIPDMGAHSNTHLSCDNGPKNLQWRKKKTASSTNVAGKIGYLPEEN
jgi:hypothetical protein